MASNEYENIIQQIRGEFSKQIERLPKIDGHTPSLRMFSSGDREDRVILLALYCSCDVKLMQICSLPVDFDMDIADEIVAIKFADALTICGNHIQTIVYSN